MREGLSPLSGLKFVKLLIQLVMKGNFTFVRKMSGKGHGNVRNLWLWQPYTFLVLVFHFEVVTITFFLIVIVLFCLAFSFFVIFFSLFLLSGAEMFHKGMMWPQL